MLGEECSGTDVFYEISYGIVIELVATSRLLCFELLCWSGQVSVAQANSHMWNCGGQNPPGLSSSCLMWCCQASSSKEISH